MDKFFAVVLLALLTFFAVPASGLQDEMLADGTPPLTRQMAERLINYYGYILNVKFTDVQRQQFQKGLVDYWENQNFQKIGYLTVVDFEATQLFAAPENERQRVRFKEREKMLQALRDETADALSQFLVAAYEGARKNNVTSCPPSATPTANASRLLKIGRYDGVVSNETAGLDGKIALDIKNIDPSSGKISARMIAYAGLMGAGELTGSMSERGELTLSGNLDEWRVCVQGKLTGSEIAATYQLEGSYPQNGNFKTAYRGEAAMSNNPASDKFPALLIGKWKFNDYQPGARASNTGPNRTTGYSKLLTIEFYDDGSYKYIETNRLCLTGSTCCRGDNQLEKGSFVITTAGFNFNFKSGDLMHTDECNASQAATRPMKTTEAHLQGLYKWSIGPTGERQVLTFCIQKDGNTVCYQRAR